MSFISLSKHVISGLFGIALITGLGHSTALGADPVSVSATTVFSQNFSTSSTPADYIGTGANQVNGFMSSTGFTWNISNGMLTGSRVAGGFGSITKKGLAIDSSSGTLGSVYSFDFDLQTPPPSNGTGLWFGIGTQYANDTVDAPTKTDSHSRFSILLRSDGTWSLNDINASITSTYSFSGKQTVTFVTNTSDTTFSYTEPFAGGVTRQLAANSWNAYVGNSLVLSGLASTATIDPTDFKLRAGGLNNTSIVLDNISVSTLQAVPIPETGASVTITALFVCTMVLVHRARKLRNTTQKM